MLIPSAISWMKTLLILKFLGTAQGAGEAMMRAFHHRYGLNYVGLRYMNVYGPRRDYHGAYIAVIMKINAARWEKAGYPWRWF